MEIPKIPEKGYSMQFDVYLCLYLLDMIFESEEYNKNELVSEKTLIFKFKILSILEYFGGYNNEEIKPKFNTHHFQKDLFSGKSNDFFKKNIKFFTEILEEIRALTKASDDLFPNILNSIITAFTLYKAKQAQADKSATN